MVLRYGSQKFTQPLELRIDPRLHPPAADLDARLALEQRVHVTLDELNTTLNAAIGGARRLPAEQRGQLERAIDDLVQRDIHSSEGDLLHPTKLREHLAFFANELEQAHEKPTPAEYATFDELHAQAVGGEDGLRRLMARR